MPTPPERLAALQKRFADHIRDPEAHPAPEGIEERRLAIYRRLFFNNVSGLFEKNFTVVRRVVPDARWKQLIRTFLREHRSTTPLFPEIGREFVRFLENRPEEHDEWPWLAELAHWQFLNTCARNDERDPAGIESDSGAGLLDRRPRLNPTLVLAAYTWPVHEIRADHVPEAPARTVLAVWRTRDDRIGRLQINAVTGRMIELLKDDDGATGRIVLERIASELEHPQPDVLIGQGEQLLKDLREREVILGSTAV